GPRVAGALPRRARPRALRAPEHLARARVKRHHRTARPAGREDHAVHHQRGAFQLELRPRAEIVGLKTPCDFELGEIGGVDLVERAVPRPREIGGVSRPVGILRCLRKEHTGGEKRNRELHIDASLYDSAPRVAAGQIGTPPLRSTSASGTLYGVPSGAFIGGLRGVLNADWMKPSHRCCWAGLRPCWVSLS